MAVFHPLRRTRAVGERGGDRGGGGGGLLVQHGAAHGARRTARLGTAWRYLPLSRRSPRTQTAIEAVFLFLQPQLFSLCLSLSPPVLIGSYLSLSYSQRLGEIETTRWRHSADVTQAAAAPRSGLVAPFCRGLNQNRRPGGDDCGAERRRRSLLIKAPPRPGVRLSTAPPQPRQGSAS